MFFLQFDIASCPDCLYGIKIDEEEKFKDSSV